MRGTKRVLITGAGGYLGLNLCASLVGHCSIRCFVRRSEALDSVLGPVDGVEIVQGDLLDPPTLNSALAEVDTVVHLAGRTRDPSPSQYFLLQTNIYGTWALLEVARAQAVSHVIFPSTYHVYGRLRDLGPGPVAEATPLKPTSIYAASKATAEALIQHSPVPTTILRLSHVFGVGVGRGDWGGVLLNMARSALSEAVIDLDEAADDVRDYVHVSDVVACLRAIVLGLVRPSGAFNVGRGVSVTLREMAETIAAGVERVRGHRVAVRAPAPPEGSERAYLDVAKIRGATGLTLSRPLGAAIDELIAKLASTS